MLKAIMISICAGVCLPLSAVGAPVQHVSIERKPYQISQRLLDAIRMVESSGNDAIKDGDGGKAIGPFQIHEAYFRDAAQYDPTLGNDYQQCRDRSFAERVVRAYMARYFPAGATDRTIAMAHNGGARIGKRVGTEAYQRAEKYWKKVSARLDN